MNMLPSSVNTDGPGHRWRETGLIFVAWTLFGLIMASQFYMGSMSGGRAAPWHIVIRHGLFEAYLWALVTIAIFWLTRRLPLERGRLIRVPVHLAAAALLALARVIAMVEASRHVRWLGIRTLERQFFSWFHTYLLFCVLLIGIAHALLYYRRYRERERAAERLAAGLTEARLHALKMQLQPHFLFNSLNAISALIPPEARPARRMVARLGDLLRISLEHEDRQEVTLREELTFLEPYLEIEHARLGERLTVVMDIDPGTLDARVPHLMLQPLVENAIRHGVAPRIEPGTVVIATMSDSDDRVLKLEVRDDGAGLTAGGESPARRGVGLANVQARLEQLYGTEHRFEITNRTQGGVSVRIAIPLRRGTAPVREETP